MPGQVLKVFHADVSASDIDAELRAMNRYHGAGFVLASPDGRSLRMPRIEGVPLHKLAPAQAPKDLADRILVCVERILDAGIYPEDMCEANFLYNARTGSLEPVDLKSSPPSASEWPSWLDAFRGEMKNLMTVARRLTPEDAPPRTVRFASEHKEATVANSWRDDSSRVAVRFKSLTKAIPALASGASLPARDIRKLLLMALAANTDHSLVSPKSEKLVIRALEDLIRKPQDTYAGGELPFDVLHSFVVRGQQVRPDLFR